MTHTPGPWFTRPNDPWAVYADAAATRTVCDVRHKGSQISEANAHLIAAAPELLATLKDVIAHLRSMTLDPGDDDDAPALVAAEALIAKAEGGS